MLFLIFSPHIVKKTNQYKHLKFTISSLSPDRTECKACPNQLKDIINTNGQCEECPEGMIPNGVKNACTKCQPEDILLFDDSCKSCPKGFIPSLNRRHCKACPKGQIADGGVCKSCQNPDTE